MSRAARVWLVQGSLALVLAGCATALVLTSKHESAPVLQLLLGQADSLSFIAAGLLGATRRPDNATGRLLALVGFTYYAGALIEANRSWPVTIGFVVSFVFLAAFVHLVLAYPTGTLTRGARTLVVSSYGLAVAVPAAAAMVTRHLPGCTGCPPSALTIHASPPLLTAFGVMAALGGATLLTSTLVLLVRRWRGATAAYRRSFRPVFLSAGLAIGLFLVQLPLSPLLPHPGDVILGSGTELSFIAVPFAFAAGLLRGRFAGAAVGRAVAALGPTPAPGGLRDALRDVLGDPSLELGYWLEDLPGYVDIEGRPFDPGERGVATMVDGELGRIGVLVHDPALLEHRELLDGVVGTARLALENERLHAELRAKLSELEEERDFTRLVVDSAPGYFCVVDQEGKIVRYNLTLEQASGFPDDESVRGRAFWDVFVAADEAADLRGAIAITAATGRTSQHESTMVSANGDRRVITWVTVPIPDARGQMHLLLVAGLDVTERKWHENVQGALRRVATLVASGTGEAALMQAVAAEVGQLFHAHSSNLLLREGDSYRIAGGWSEGPALTWEPGTEFPVTGDTATGRAIGSGRPERVDSFDELEHEVARELWRAHGTQSSIAAPIVVEGALWGVISVSRITVERFPPDAADRLGDFAALVAQAVANAAAQEEVRASRARLVAAADAERKKLERNLHDGAQQRLVSISIALRLAQRRIESAPGEASSIINGAAEELAHALDELRELARGIHPAMLTDRGLTPALGALADRAPLPVTIESDLEERLPSPVEAAAYYVVSESLANVAKYAHASAVAVRVTRHAGVAVVEVSDDGVGGADPSRGSGLRGLADRVAALDGRLGVESAQGAGTRIWAEIPCV